jgi:NAD(P)H-hydrate epimerase
VIERSTTLPKVPARPAEGHKGMFGRVLIVGGNPEMLGAPVLAGTAALRSGAGLVQIAVPRQILPPALSVTPELIGLGLATKRDDARLLEAAGRADALVIGPGLGESAAAKSRLMRLIKLDKPMVLDADALNMLAAQKRWPGSFCARAILTPHPGEMKRLARLLGREDVPTDDDGRIEIATVAANHFKQVVVLKGHRTVVTDGRRAYVNDTGDSTLSKAGSGDVLSGIVGTLLAQEMELFDAACAGVWIHGRAGEIAGKRFGRRSALSREVIDAVAEAMRELERLSPSPSGRGPG